MYVTRPLSLYRKFPSALSAEPPEGPYTGYLVITDEESETQDTYCFGACKKRRVKRLPFPQDNILNVIHSSEYHETILARKKVWFLPVLDQPLSSNCYYVIKAKGRYKGYVCSVYFSSSLSKFDVLLSEFAGRRSHVQGMMTWVYYVASRKL